MSPPPRSPSSRRLMPAVTGQATIAVAALLTAGHSVSRLGLAALGGAAAGYALAARRYSLRARAEIAAARRDPLTGLPTRAVGDQLMAEATAAAEPVAVALADVDGLHAVNANFGHAAGDQYLLAVAQRLARAVPEGGTLIRQGGDEFAVIVPRATADALATALGPALAGPAVVAGHQLQPRASIGIADSRAGHAHRALARADAAMYSAKLAGGNAILTYSRNRDGEPAADGTRPAVRRRNLITDSGGASLFAPHQGDRLVTMLVSADELRLLRDALHRPGPGVPPDSRTAGASTPARPQISTGPRAGLAARLNNLLEAAQGIWPAPHDPSAP